MLTNVYIENFKNIREADIQLDKQVVFIGPNNSGKTSALQAIALWETGLKEWCIKKGDEPKELKKRPGITMNRKDLVAISVPDSKLLW